MIYFIPSWYNPSRKWYTTDHTWFLKNEVMDFDDISTQSRLFQNGKEEIKLIILKYAPSIRRFLHRQTILRVPYWSVFDELQSYEHDYVRPINYLTMEWPEDVSFHYNPYIVNVMKDDEIFARVYPTQDGTLFSVRYYKGGIPAYEHVYDDRGFFSSVLIYDEKGEPDRQNYLSIEGDQVISEQLKTGKVIVSPKHTDRFQKQEYDSIGDMIQERLQAYLQSHDDAADTLVLALDEQHNQLVLDSLGKQTLILSEYSGRANDRSPELVARSKAIFTDDINTDHEKETLPVLRIYPLENQATFGASTNESNLYISLFIDNLSKEELDDIVSNIMKHLDNNERTMLLLCTFRCTEIEYVQQIEGAVKKYNNLLAEKEKTEVTDVFVAEMMGSKEARIQIASMGREVELLQTIAKSRVYIDLGEPENGSLNTEAICAGVPQIKRKESTFLTHMKNGYIVHNNSEIDDALNFFLVGLKNWNESLLYYTQLKEEYTDEQILSRWDSLKEEIMHEDSSNRLQ